MVGGCVNVVYVLMSKYTVALLIQGEYKRKQSSKDGTNFYKNFENWYLMTKERIFRKRDDDDGLKRSVKN